MNESIGADEKPDYAWCDRLLEELDFSDNAGNEVPGLPAADDPEWVWNVMRELSQQAAPSLALHNQKHPPPDVIGLLLGQQCANFQAVKLSKRKRLLRRT